MNKLFAFITLTFCMTTAHADERGNAYSACAAQAKQLYGDAARVKLRNLRNYLGGYKLKLKVSGTDTGTMTATCVYRDGLAEILEPSGSKAPSKEGA